MSHIANELNNLLKEKNKSAAEIARLTGITAGHLSRLKNGVQIWIDKKDLISIAEALAGSTKGENFNKIHSRLLHSHLLDECTGPGAKYIDIQIASKPAPMILRDCLSSKPVLPPRMQENLDTIADHIANDRNVRDLIETVANLCRNGKLPAPNSR